MIYRVAWANGSAILNDSFDIWGFAMSEDSILFQCDSCQAKLKAKQELAGKTVRCPKCGHDVAVPSFSKANVPVTDAPSPTLDGSFRRRELNAAVNGSRFYSVFLSKKIPHGRESPWCWSKPFASASEAHVYGATMVRENKASIAFVVGFDGGRKTILNRFTYPGPSQKVIYRYTELLELINKPA